MRLRRVLAVAAVVGGVAGAGGGVAAAQMPGHGGAGGGGGMGGGAGMGDVSILSASFAPAQVDVVAGDTVHWENASVLRHTVTADDGTSFASGQLFGGGTFEHRFAATGEFAYHCTIHPYMRGVVDVHSVLLDAPREPGAPGRPYVLQGRSSLPAGADVGIEREAAGGAFEHVGDATVGAGGSFTAPVRASTSSRYRAVTSDGDASPTVQLLIVDRSVSATTTGGGRGVVRVRVTPVSPGSVVVLQLYQREHFGWWPVRRTRVDKSSRAVFKVSVARKTRARVVLTLADGATILASSPVVTVEPRRRR